MVTATAAELLSDVEPSSQVGAPTGLPASPPDFPSLPRGPYAKPRHHTRIREAPGRLVSLANRRLQHGRPFVQPEGNLSPAYLAAKRLLDVAGSLILLALLGPIMLVTFLVLLVTTRGRPLFWQRRIGHCGRPFMMVKFRTMRLDAERRRHEVENEKDGPIFKNRHDPRITRIGRLLRKTSIDETPQLFSVLWGRMSLVGPRPPLGTEVVQYKAWQRRRLAVKSGLTCLWQVSGRSEIGFDDWVRMDIWYLKNQSFGTDLKLLLRTPLSVFSGRGAY